MLIDTVTQNVVIVYYITSPKGCNLSVHTVTKILVWYIALQVLREVICVLVLAGTQNVVTESIRIQCIAYQSTKGEIQ